MDKAFPDHHSGHQAHALRGSQGRGNGSPAAERRSAPQWGEKRFRGTLHYVLGHLTRVKLESLESENLSA